MGPQRCGRCGGKHNVTDYHQKESVCYRCQKPGHFIADFPIPTGHTIGNIPPRMNCSPLRVNNLTQEDILEQPELVTGIFIVQDKPAYVLFDTGASQSYLSSYFAQTCTLDFDTKPLTHALQVITPIGLTTTDRVTKGIIIIIEGRTILFDLILLDIRDLDVILGMDWLQHVRATIEFQREG